jgi:hypothetical protein
MTAANTIAALPSQLRWFAQGILDLVHENDTLQGAREECNRMKAELEKATFIALAKQPDARLVVCSHCGNESLQPITRQPVGEGMTAEKVKSAALEVAGMINGRFTKLEPKRQPDLQSIFPLEHVKDYAAHLLHVCQAIPGFIDEGRREKAMRWLGFAQGAAWALGWTCVKELAEHNRPQVVARAVPGVPDGTPWAAAPLFVKEETNVAGEPIFTDQDLRVFVLCGGDPKDPGEYAQKFLVKPEQSVIEVLRNAAGVFARQGVPIPTCRAHASRYVAKMGNLLATLLWKELGELRNRLNGVVEEPEQHDGEFCTVGDVLCIQVKGKR